MSLGLFELILLDWCSKIQIYLDMNLSVLGQIFSGHVAPEHNFLINNLLDINPPAKNPPVQKHSEILPSNINPPIKKKTTINPPYKKLPCKKPPDK